MYSLYVIYRLILLISRVHGHFHITLSIYILFFSSYKLFNSIEMHPTSFYEISLVDIIIIVQHKIQLKKIIKSKNAFKN